MFTDLSLQVTLGSVPSSQISHYRSPLWVRQSWQLQNLPISLYRSPLAGAKFSEISLQITALLIRKMEKKMLYDQQISRIKKYWLHFVKKSQLISVCMYMYKIVLTIKAEKESTIKYLPMSQYL